ncbi:hypothetical protein [Streptomyces sp. NPDC008265]|uniref:hypothetical protein n=1 Tax=Streptomyces sp. NPDC008265 TaxID=3364824 RepID=UPI0036E77092
MTVTVSVVAGLANAPEQDPRIGTLCLMKKVRPPDPSWGPELSNAADLPICREKGGRITVIRA